MKNKSTRCGIFQPLSKKTFRTHKLHFSYYIVFMCVLMQEKKNNNALTRQPLNEYELNIVCECMWFSVFLHSKCDRYTIKNVQMLHISLNCCEFVIIFFCLYSIQTKDINKVCITQTKRTVHLLCN